MKSLREHGSRCGGLTSNVLETLISLSGIFITSCLTRTLLFCLITIHFDSPGGKKHRKLRNGRGRQFANEKKYVAEVDCGSWAAIRGSGRLRGERAGKECGAGECGLPCGASRVSGLASAAGFQCVGEVDFCAAKRRALDAGDLRWASVFIREPEIRGQISTA